MNLREQAIRGVKWTSVSSIIIAVIQLTQFSILAHYLEVSDFGLMAVVTVIIGFSTLFLDFGISAFIIHKQDITHVQLSSLYWLNIVSGLVLFIIVYTLAPTFANFYNAKELIPIIQLLAVSFVISALGSQYGLLFQKALKFNIMAKISLVSVIVGFFVAVISAINGKGVYALVYASLATAVVTTFFNIIFGIKEHLPSFIFKYHEIVPAISFGMFQMGGSCVRYLNQEFDVILIGKLLGPEALGIYTLAKNLSLRPMQIINPIVTKVSFPIMAKVHTDTIKLRDIYLRTLNYLSSINFPIYVLLAILAEPIVLTLFGEKWNESIIILQILSAFAAIRSTGNLLGSLVLAKGRADLSFYIQLIRAFFMPLVIYIGSFWGLNGVAYSLLALVTFYIIPNWYYVVRPLCESNFKEYFWLIIRPLIFAIIGGFFANVITLFMGIENMYVNSGLITVTIGVVVLLLNVRFNREFIDIWFELIAKRKGR